MHTHFFAALLVPYPVLLVALVLWHALSPRKRSAWKIYLGFLVTQALAMALFAGTQVVVQAPDNNLAVGVAFDVLFILLDVVVLKMGHDYEEALRAKRSLVVKEEQMNVLVQEYAHVQEASREFSHMRHDIRNQAQVIVMLMKNGDETTALEHLDTLISRIQGQETPQ